MSLDLSFNGRTHPLILCLGAHSDDIEIGALATIFDLKKKCPNCRIVWVVFSATNERATEARVSAEFCCEGFHDSKIIMHSFRDGHFPAEYSEIKDAFESLKNLGFPDLIFTHHRKDAHQDHRTISEITWQTYRNQLILEYEVPKYDGDFGKPNLFVAISEEAKTQKLLVLNRFFVSQNKRPWFDRKTFESLMHLRGIECNATSGFAEAFYGRKMLLELVSTD
jgi:LmbE family N-acetylglucosaminyl deacetylase